MANTDFDDADNREWGRQQRRRHQCRCSGDMPGQCPGPAFCPMEQGREEEWGRFLDEADMPGGSP